MYSAIVHKTQRIEISFDEQDFLDWKRSNPDEKHTYENYAMYIAKNADDEFFWDTVDFNLICIVYSKED